VKQGDDGSIGVRMIDGPDLEGSHLVVASGQIPDLDGLNLKAARIRVAPSGIVVDHHMRSSNAKVFAIGHSPQSATHEAGIAFRNAVLRLPTRLDPSIIPRLVHCRPELASIGLTEEQARARFSAIRVLRAPYSDNGRAHAENATQGHVKAVATPDGKILGCSIVGNRAHDLIMPWALAMAKGLTATDLAEAAPGGAVYSQVTKEAGLEFVKISAQSPWLRRALGFIRSWG
jgi:pyruvate/2-oxoglutarate dehydrogenase complex dihydrolipoamide dehydrogenase (E3) component